MARVLIIDDDEILSETLSDKLEGMGHQVTSAFTLKEGLKKTVSEMSDVVYLDVVMPDGNGLDMLPAFRKAPSSPEVIIMTGEGRLSGAKLAIKSGAWDYVAKPSSLDALILPFLRAVQYRGEKKAHKKTVCLKRDNIVGSSPAIKACLDLVARAANSDANVIVTGETGTGKELFAEAIHQNSRRADQSFVVVDCPVLPEPLVGNVLFGHARGAFTGADGAKDGLVKQADGGTLFLDEVGELPLSVQKAFLRVLQERRFRPIGGNQEVKSNFRLVAATNRNLDDMVKDGHFRQDLLFRLKALSIHLPPLRNRTEDISTLAMHCLNKACHVYRINTKGFSPEFLEAILAYAWPGNIRELFNTLDSVITAAQDTPTLFPKHLPEHIRIKLAQTSIGQESPATPPSHGETVPAEPLLPWRHFKENAETEYFFRLMSVSGGDVNEACKISCLSRTRLYQLIQKHGLPNAATPKPRNT